MAVLEVSARRNKLGTALFATLTSIGAVFTLWSMANFFSDVTTAYSWGKTVKTLHFLISLLFTGACAIPLVSTMDGIMRMLTLGLAALGEVLVIVSAIAVYTFAVKANSPKFKSWAVLCHYRKTFHALVLLLQLVPLLVAALPDALSAISPLD